jgi:hypothetical protein
MSPKELKTLVLNAKEYLKEKILQSPEYKKSEMSELPKTLKGLVRLADSFGISVHKISLEEVQEKAAPKLETKNRSKIELHVHKESFKTEQKVEVKSEMPKLKEALNLGSKVAQKGENVPAKESPVVETKAIPKKEPSTFKEVAKTAFKHEKIEVKVEQIRVTSKTEPFEEIKISKEIKQVQNQRVEVTPLFKAQTRSSESAIQSVVTVHSFKNDIKELKVKTQENSKNLPYTKKSPQINSSLTADFVVDTAKVIAPDTTTKLSKGLESLLFSQSGESTASSNAVESVVVHKTDSFEVKLNEAKQMIKYLSSDVKTAIEDYKSPFTRVKLQLNPQKLGEVDLTIAQRGKNLHINLSSNSAAINTLSMNANELRVQLNNSGINNASLNFNNSSQSDNSNASGQQQSQHNKREAENEYTYFENEETNEEIVNSLEIVVPDYA